MIIKEYKKVRAQKTRTVLALIMFFLAITQFVWGINMIYLNTEVRGTKISAEDFDSLTVGTEVFGTVTNVVACYQSATGGMSTDSIVNCYVSVTRNDNMLLFRAMQGTKVDEELQQLMEHQRTSVDFMGKVNNISFNEDNDMSVWLAADRVRLKNHIKGKKLDYTVDVLSADFQYPPKIIALTFAGGVIVLVWGCFLIRKIINNMLYTLGVKRGKLDPNIQVKKEDLIFENEGLYTSEGMKADDYFYVNTEHNVRNEGDIGTETNSEDGIGNTLRVNGVEKIYYESGVNDEDNFYVDSKAIPGYTLKNDDDDDDPYVRKNY